MHEGDALGARSRVELVGLKAVQLDAAGERRDGAGNEAQQRGFAAGVGSQDGHQLALVGLERGGFEREERSRVGARRVGVAGLLDVHAHVRARRDRRRGRSFSGAGVAAVSDAFTPASAAADR